VIYARGDGVPADREESRKWLDMAAKQGYAPAARVLREFDQQKSAGQ